MLKTVLKIKGVKSLSKNQQKLIEGGMLGSGTGPIGRSGFPCSFGGGICFLAIDEFHCTVQLGNEPCPQGGVIIS